MNDVIAAIRSRGYWSVVVRPATFHQKLIPSLTEVEEVLRDCHIQLRGWDYPHYREGEAKRLADHIEGWVSWEEHHEVWRLYQSGQFVHLFAMREDWYGDSTLGQPDVPPGTVLSVLSSLYSITEIHTFAARLATRLRLVGNVHLSIKLTRLGGRQLQILEPGRVPLSPHRKSAAELSEYGDSWDHPVGTLIGRANELAIDFALELFDRFSWEAPRARLVEDQRRLLEQRW
ncbi:MAG: hypothetical protein AB7L66_05165 [Gemmatimonadales bacterium]